MSLSLRTASALCVNQITLHISKIESNSPSLQIFAAMADDAMLINFEVGENLAVSKPKYKGGSWKDRLSAKKSALYHRKKAVQSESQLEVDAASKTDRPPQISQDQATSNRHMYERPRKKRRTSNDATEGYDRVKMVKSSLSGARGKPGQPKEVISSLFSFNPSSQAPKTDEIQNNDPVLPSNAPLSDELSTFTSMGLTAPVAEHLLQKMEITAPTAVQRSAVTQLLRDDSDVFIQAETGSGKTLAYLLPIVQRLISASAGQGSSEAIHRDSGLFAIIIAPTRELGKQISAVLESLLRCAHYIVSGIVIGGEKKQSEKARIRKGLNILVATPGRLADHLDHTKCLDVSKVRWLVLDEGDRLMELGFGDDIKKILSRLEERAEHATDLQALPSKRVTVLCSATMRSDVQRLGELSLNDAVHVQGSSADEDTANSGLHIDTFSAPAQLQQSYAVVPAKQRLVSLVAFLKQLFVRKDETHKVIVFLSCADSVDFHFELLARETSLPSTSTASTPTKAPLTLSSDPARTTAPSPLLSTINNTLHIHRLHGSLPQQTRTQTLLAFRKTIHPSILFSTDLASRGLDLPLVDHILEFDPPFAPADHLHRVGRTARAGCPGKACIFLLPGAEENYLSTLQSLHRASLPKRIDTPTLLRKNFTPPGLIERKDWESRATDWQLDAERWALETPRALEMARRAFQSHVRAYATHGAAEKQTFDIKELHLGHLAKAFALRDRPGNVGVPGLRPGGGAGGEKRWRVRSDRLRRGDGSVGGDGGAYGVRNTRDDVRTVDGNTDAVGAAKRKMREKMREQAAVSEFNLG